MTQIQTITEEIETYMSDELYVLGWMYRRTLEVNKGTTQFTYSELKQLVEESNQEYPFMTHFGIGVDSGKGTGEKMAEWAENKYGK